MNSLIKRANPAAALRALRAPISVIFYLNHPIAHDNWVAAANDVRAELTRVEIEWFAQGNGREPVVAYWDEWLRDFMSGRAEHTRTWVRKWVEEMRKYWATQSGTRATQTMQVLRTLNIMVSDLEVFLDGLD